MIYVGETGIQLDLTVEEARACSHQGRCDDDVQALAREAHIRRQLACIEPQDLVRELQEYGAWEPSELEDHDENLLRFIWLAAAYIAEEAG